VKWSGLGPDSKRRLQVIGKYDRSETIVWAAIIAGLIRVWVLEGSETMRSIFLATGNIFPSTPESKNRYTHPASIKNAYLVALISYRLKYLRIIYPF
jgi:hypothetical protein